MRINSQIGTLSLRHQTTPLSDGIDSGKESAIESMIEDGYTPSLKGPDPTQREQLHSGLSKVDRGVLLWARRQGVKIQVLQKGEVLEQADVLRDLTGKFEQRIDSEKVDQIAGHLSDLSEKIRTENDPEENKKWRIRKRNRLAEILTANPCGAAVFTPTFAPLLAPGLSKLLADPTETPTLKALALHHGADSPEEQKQFYQWMEKLNGKRLATAREAGIQEKSQLLSARPDAQKRWLDQAEKHPELVPLDVTLHTVVVPDAHFFPSHDGGDELLLDRSDMSSIKGWRDNDFRGQWFFLEGKSHILVRDDAVGLDTPTHELGHVVDMKLEKTAPGFYSGLKPRIEKSFDQARQHNKTVTQYSRANPREYVAEGFAAYYNQPQALREKDPELHQIIKEMVDYCCQEAGVDKILEICPSCLSRKAETRASHLSEVLPQVEHRHIVFGLPKKMGLRQRIQEDPKLLRKVTRLVNQTIAEHLVSCVIVHRHRRDELKNASTHKNGYPNHCGPTHLGGQSRLPSAFTSVHQ